MDNLTVKNLQDGRILLQLNGRHLWANTPKYTKTFHGENALYDWFDWIIKNTQSLEWLEDRKIEVQEFKDDGVIIDLGHE